MAAFFASMYFDLRFVYLLVATVRNTRPGSRNTSTMEDVGSPKLGIKKDAIPLRRRITPGAAKDHPPMSTGSQMRL